MQEDQEQKPSSSTTMPPSPTINMIQILTSLSNNPEPSIFQEALQPLTNLAQRPTNLVEKIILTHPIILDLVHGMFFTHYPYTIPFLLTLSAADPFTRFHVANYSSGALISRLVDALKCRNHTDTYPGGSIDVLYNLASEERNKTQMGAIRSLFPALLNHATNSMIIRSRRETAMLTVLQLANVKSCVENLQRLLDLGWATEKLLGIDKDKTQEGGPNSVVRRGAFVLMIEMAKLERGWRRLIDEGVIKEIVRISKEGDMKIWCQRVMLRMCEGTARWDVDAWEVKEKVLMEKQEELSEEGRKMVKFIIERITPLKGRGGVRGG